jgi:DNA processing protein
MVPTEDLASWVQLSRVPGVGVQLFLRLVESFGSPHSVFESPIAKLHSIRGVGAAVAERIHRAHSESTRKEAEAELHLAEKTGVRIITVQDEEYPAILRTIYAPPPLLYVRGDPSSIEPVSVAMVGTRQASTHGIRAAESIAAELAAHGITIVSGLAQGIDSACHEGALAGGGKTVAVLGCGLGHQLPSRRRRLLERIVDRGAVLSEFAMTMPPLAENFPRRNRIISGLCAATVVVEAGERSGALITASFAAEQGREVFAVPGRINDLRSAGCNRLIQDGARLAQCAADIRQVVASRIPRETPVPGTAKKSTEGEPARFQERVSRPSFALTGEEVSIYRMMSGEARHVDELTRESGYPPHRVAQILLGLELKGAVVRESGMRYARSS